MKNSILRITAAFVICSFIAINVQAQDKTSARKKTNKADKALYEPTGWVEMDAFQKMFTADFGAAQKGDFSLIRKDAQQLTDLSIKLAKSDYPAELDNTEMQLALGAMTDKCEEVNQLVNSGNSDQDILEQLTNLNNQYKDVRVLRNMQLTEKK